MYKENGCLWDSKGLDYCKTRSTKDTKETNITTAWLFIGKIRNLYSD